MFIALIILVMVIFPVLFVAIEAAVFHNMVSVFTLAAKWFVFWAVGIRLFSAGMRQVLRPSSTAREIFRIQTAESYPIMQEVGFGNLAIGTLGICSLYRSGWIVPAAVAGGLYFGLAGLLHIFRKQKNAMEQTAMVSDAYAFVVLLVVVVKSGA